MSPQTYICAIFAKTLMHTKNVISRGIFLGLGGVIQQVDDLYDIVASEFAFVRMLF